MNLTSSEMVIMNILWEKAQWVTISQLIKELELKNISWKRQTVNTFLARLIAKKIVIQNGRKYIYTYNQFEYEKMKAVAFLETEYDGSLKKFVFALTGGDAIDKKEAEELMSYLEKLKGE